MARAHFSIARLWSFVSPCGLSAPSNSSRTPPSRPRAEPRSRASACEPREFRSISRARPFLSRGSNQLVALRLRQPVGANQFHALGSSRPLDGFMVLPRQTAFGASICQAANKFCRGSDGIVALNSTARIRFGESFRWKERRVAGRLAVVVVARAPCPTVAILLEPHRPFAALCVCDHDNPTP